MPDSPNENHEAILARRARELARPLTDAAARVTLAQVVVVSLGKEQLGLPVESLKGVFEQFSITPLIGTPAWLAGIAHVRGELISVVHLTHWLKQETTSTPKILAVLGGAYGSIGILVDGVVGFRDIHEGELSEALTERAQRNHQPVKAVTKDLVALLDIDSFLSHRSLLVDGGG